MKSMPKMIASLIVISVLTAGCSLLAGGNANSQTAQETAVANTVVALQNVLSINSNPTLPAESITPTPQILPTYTAIASIQPTTAPEYVPVATTEPQFRITDIQDITVPDNSVYKPGDTFTKIWQLTNGGSATWSSDFKLVFVNGDLMGATTVTLGHTVAPNQTVDVSVNLVAPATDGTYQGNFMLQTNSGNSFGFGAAADQAFWVKIIVRHNFQVTAATVNASPSTYTGACPANISLSASITSTGAGTVTYYFVTSAGNSSTSSITFGNAEIITSTAISWPVTSSGSLTVHVYIDAPNHQDFSPITIPVTCTP